MPQDALPQNEDAEKRLARVLAGRGFAMRPLVLHGGRGPEGLAHASRDQRDLVAHAKGFPWTGEGRCAAWVAGVFAWAGLGYEGGNARDFYERHCVLDDPARLKVAMIVAVPTHPFDVEGRRFGHVGIYVGDGQVMDCVDAGVRTVPFSLWYGAYGVTAEPRWGWMREIALG